VSSFSTHIKISGAASSIAASFCVSFGIIQPNEAVFYVAAGIAGGMLPDLDCDTCIPIRIYAIAVALIVWNYATIIYFSFPNPTLHVYIGAILPLSASFATYTLGIQVFKGWSVHRGVMHSILFVAAVWAVSRAFFGDIFAAFIAGNALLHLASDEAYSLVHGKKSLGTALKLAGSGFAENAFFLGVFIIAYNYGFFSDFLR
jgi:hypothetical protein